MPYKIEPFLIEMRAEARRYQEELVASGQLVTAEEFCTLIGVDTQYLKASVLTQKLFAFEIGEQLFYPRFYAEHETSIRLKIEDVSAALGALSPAQKWQFFTRPKGSLAGVTPVDALARGLFDKVMVAAKGFITR